MRGIKTAGLTAASLLMACSAQEPSGGYANAPRYFNVPYVATPHEVVTAMLQLASTGSDDVVYELGSGDGRIAIAAVRDFGASKAVGIEIDQTLVNKAAANAAAADVSERAQFKNADIYEEDFSDATIITMYLADDANKILRPRLEAQLAPGSRIVSHLFRMGDWKPEKTVRVGDRSIYLWTVR